MVLRSQDRLRPLGRLSRADRSGHLPRLGRAPTGRWAGLLCKLAEDLRQRSGGDVSVVLRGSLARGARTAADIDLVAITDGEAGIAPLDAAALPLPVEISVIPRSAFLTDPTAAWLRFALAHCGWTLAGPDLLADLPEPRLGGVAIAHLRDVRHWWPLHPLDWSAGLAERRLICAWLAKRLIRSLAEGEMVRRGVYSRDIWPCLQVAQRAFPAARTDLRHIALQAIAADGGRTACGARPGRPPRCWSRRRPGTSDCTSPCPARRRGPNEKRAPGRGARDRLEGLPDQASTVFDVPSMASCVAACAISMRRGLRASGT